MAWRRPASIAGLIADNQERLAATPGASLPLDASVLSIVANLEGLDLNGLRRQWRAHLGGEPPAHLPRWLLMRVLAYRLQADTFGGLDKSIQRTLRSDKDRGAAMPFDRRIVIRTVINNLVFDGATADPSLLAASWRPRRRWRFAMR